MPVRAGRPPREARGDDVVVADTVLSLDGSLDPASADRLRARLLDVSVPGRRLVLDLSQVTHVSAAALAVLVAVHRRLRDGGGCLVVAAPSAAVVREMRVSGLYRVIEVEGLDPD